MTARFAVHLPFEVAYQRDVKFVVELLDPVTLERVSQGLTVTATGLTGRPIVNLGGHFVWLEESAVPQRVRVDPGTLRYEPEDLPAPLPPARLLRVLLRPKAGYAFGSGVTAVRSSLYESIATPPVPVPGVTVGMQWLDDGAAIPAWVDSAPPARTSAAGDFVTFVRFAATAVPGLDATGRLRARFTFERSGAPPVRISPEFSLTQGRTTDLAPFAWDAL
jgi:hypothetical protein